jgi:hypothetical protein
MTIIMEYVKILYDFENKIKYPDLILIPPNCSKIVIQDRGQRLKYNFNV